MKAQKMNRCGTFAAIGTIALMLSACLSPPETTGPVGPQGPAGLNGTDGRGCTAAPVEQGIEITCPSTDGGVTVVAVLNGTNGTDGAQGPAGLNGTDGTNGTDGRDGVDGQNGSNGTDGAQGPAGQNGTNGVGCTAEATAGGYNVTCPGLDGGTVTWFVPAGTPPTDGGTPDAGVEPDGGTLDRCLGVSCPGPTNGGCLSYRCEPATGTCVEEQAARGTACNDGNACTGVVGQADYCMAGQCLAGGNKVCVAVDECHSAGVCNPATGSCSNPPVAEDTLCTGGVCRAGVCTDLCVGYTCPVADECHSAGTCNPQSGTCTLPAKPDGTQCSVGACVAGACRNLCAGVTCAQPVSTCQAAECNPATGACSVVNVVNGFPCNDGNACTGTTSGQQGDTCIQGQCLPGTPTVCPGAGQCLVPICNAVTGACSVRPDVAGTPCNDGNACTSASACDGQGMCTGSGQLSCDDSNPWTADSCWAPDGCVHHPYECQTTCTVPTALQGTGRYCEVWTMWGGYDAVGSERDDMANGDGEVWVTAEEYYQSWWTPEEVEVQVRVFGPGLEAGQWVGGSYARMRCAVDVPLHEVVHPWTSPGAHNYGTPVGGIPWRW